MNQKSICFCDCFFHLVFKGQYSWQPWKNHLQISSCNMKYKVKRKPEFRCKCILYSLFKIFDTTAENRCLSCSVPHVINERMICQESSCKTLCSRAGH